MTDMDIASINFDTLEAALWNKKGHRASTCLCLLIKNRLVECESELYRAKVQVKDV